MYQMYNNVFVARRYPGNRSATLGFPARYVINNNSVACAIPDREFQTGSGPRDDDRAALQFALWRCLGTRGVRGERRKGKRGGRFGKHVGRNFRGDECATRRANNMHVIMRVMIERDRRVSRFDDAKSIPRTSLSGLNDAGRRATQISFAGSPVVGQLT